MYKSFFFKKISFSSLTVPNVFSSYQSRIKTEESVAAEGAKAQKETTQIPQEAPKQRHVQHARPHLLHP